MKNALLVATGVGIGLLAAVFAAGARADGLPEALAQAGPGGGAGASGVTIVGTGGGTQNQNDLCWVLSKVQPARGNARLVLAMYRAKRNGEYFDLEDVRMIEADLRMVELKGEDHKRNKTDFHSVLKSLPKEEQEDIIPRQPGQPPAGGTNNNQRP